MAVFSAIGALISWAGMYVFGYSLSTAITIAITIKQALILGTMIFGGIALSRSSAPKVNGFSSSPTYSSPVLQTQTNNELPVPMVYGTVKMGGNRIWQNPTTESTIKRIVAFGEGEFSDFTEIKLNDIDAATVNATVTKFVGTDSQVISNLVSGANNAERAAVVGGLKNIAYLAISVNKSDRIDVNYNLTTTVIGREVRVYTDEFNYNVTHSDNPAWCLLDFLTAYNGAGIGLGADGDRDDALIREKIDIQSFIDAASFCDDLISFYAYTTNLTGNNNDLIWKSRAAGDQDLTVTYVNPGSGHPTASISVDVNNNITVNLKNTSGTIQTTASEIIALVEADPDINKLVKVTNADNNNGSGVVTAMSQQSFVAGDYYSRYSFNMVFDSKFTVMDAIEEFKKNCRGTLAYKNGKLQFKVDKPEIVSKVFEPKDIIRGSETFRTLPNEELYDILRIKYVSPENEWSKVEAQAELKEFKHQPAIMHNADIFSITNHNQAARMAWYYLNKTILCPYSGSFKTGYKASDLEVGDVIEYSGLVMTQFVNYKVKVAAVEDDNAGGFTVHWFTYNEDLYTEEAGDLEPVINPIIIDRDEKLRSATFIVAAADTINKSSADFIVDENSTKAQDIINQAIDRCEENRLILESGSLQSGSTKTVLVLDPEEYDINQFYNGLYIRFTSGACASEGWKLIDDWKKATKKAAVGLVGKYAYVAAVSGSSVTLSNDVDTTYGYPSPSSVNDFYKDMYLRIPSLTGTDYEIRKITAYNGTTKVATVDSAFSAPASGKGVIIGTKNDFTNTPTTGDTYEISIFQGKVVLLEGNYYIDAPIKVISGVSLEGMGASSVIHSAVGYDEAVGPGVDEKIYAAITTKNRHGIIRANLRDFVIANYGALDTNIAIQTGCMHYCTISNIKIENCLNAISADRILRGEFLSDRNTIENNKIIKKKYRGIYVGGDFNDINNNGLHGGSNDGVFGVLSFYNYAVASFGSYNTIGGNSVSFSSGGVLIGRILADEDKTFATSACINNSIINNTINNCFENGVFVYSDASSIKNNVIRECGEWGILCAADNCSICDNFVAETGYHGISVYGFFADNSGTADNNIIDSNTVLHAGRAKNNTSACIYVGQQGSASYNTITNNICRSPSSGNKPFSAIWLNTAAYYNRVTNNDFTNGVAYGYAVIYNQGTGTIDTGNRT